MVLLDFLEQCTNQRRTRVNAPPAFTCRYQQFSLYGSSQITTRENITKTNDVPVAGVANSIANSCVGNGINQRGGMAVGELFVTMVDRAKSTR